jgi:hypothetical protein
MAKGGQAEREVSVDLSLWWSNGQRQDLIWRTSGSGARFTTRAKAGLRTAGSAGDFTYIDAIAKPLFDLLLLENKIGYNKQIDPLSKIDSSKADILDTWLKKAYVECSQAKRFYPMVIFKRNRKDRCVLMPILLFHEIAKRVEASTTFSRMVLYPQKTVIMGFDSFIHWCTPDIIKDILRKARQ